MINRILMFIFNERENKFLLFRESDNPLKFGVTLTENIGKNEISLEVVNKVIKNKLGITPKEILALNWGSVYKLKGEEVYEMNYLVFVDSDKILIKDKTLKYEWLELNNFIDKIDWGDNKRLLKKVLLKAIDKEVFFDKKEREESSRK